jgi:predicted aspartyl protease
VKLWVVGLLNLGFFFQPPATRDDGAHEADSSIPVGIPFKLSGGFLVTVEGRISTLTKLKFVLDTGVTHSVVDQKIANKLGIVRHPSQMFEFDKVIGVDEAVIPDMQFGPVRLINVSMLVADLASFSKLAIHADVLLGSDLLSLNPFTIDYNARRVLFSALEQAKVGEPLNSGPALLTVEFQVQGQRLRLLVDTGFPEVLLFEDRVLKHAPLIRVDSLTNRFGIGGRLYARRGIMPETDLGKKNTNLSVVLVKAPPDDVLPDIDGLFGIASLKAHRIHFDYASNSLSWE